MVAFALIGWFAYSVVTRATRAVQRFAGLLTWRGWVVLEGNVPVPLLPAELPVAFVVVLPNPSWPLPFYPVPIINHRPLLDHDERLWPNREALEIAVEKARSRLKDAHVRFHVAYGHALPLPGMTPSDCKICHDKNAVGWLDGDAPQQAEISRRRETAVRR